MEKVKLEEKEAREMAQKALEKYRDSLIGASSEEEIKIPKGQSKANNQTKAKNTSKNTEYIRKMKESIDNEIEDLRKPLETYLQSHYDIIRQLTGKADKNDAADFESYYKLRTELFSFNFTLTPFYPCLLKMERELKALVNTSDELSSEKLNSVIDSNLSNFKMELYSIYNFSDEAKES